MFLENVARQLNMEIVDYPIEENLAVLGWQEDTEKNPIVQALWQTNRYDSWIASGKVFLDKHQRHHQGRRPLLDTWVRDTWESAEKNKSSLRDLYVENIKTLKAFRDMFNQHILPSSTLSGSEGMWVDYVEQAG